MMDLQKNFKRAAAALIVAGIGFAAPAQAEDTPAEPIDISALVPSGRVCVPFSGIQNPRGPIERYVSDMYRLANNAQMDQAGFGDRIGICLDHELDKEDSCGTYAIGQFYIDVMSLNPALRVSDQERLITMNHELRHKWQQDSGIFAVKGGNISEGERLAMNWALETDARLSSILLAYEMSRQGHPEYVESIRFDKMLTLMYQAFEKKLQDNPEDIPSALRAGFLASMERSSTMQIYAYDMVDWIEKNNRAFNPAEESDHLLSEETLGKLGQMGIYKYMDGDLMDSIRKLYSNRVYKELVEMRQRSGGVQGEACKPKQADAMAGPS